MTLFLLEHILSQLLLFDLSFDLLLSRVFFFFHFFKAEYKLIIFCYYFVCLSNANTFSKFEICLVKNYNLFCFVFVLEFK